VRPSDAAAEATRGIRDRPRLVFTTGHALAVIVLLIAALGASLTMLVQQSANLTALSQSGNSMESESGGSRASGQKPGSASADDDGSASADAGGASLGGAANDADGGAGSATTGDASSDDASTGDASPDAGGDVPDADSSDSAGKSSSLINLNTATSEQLQTIKGVGPVTAQRIIDHRTTIGRYASVDQLLDVKGIGAKTLEKMRGQVTVE
jgi:competence protein ComEA